MTTQDDKCPICGAPVRSMREDGSVVLRCQDCDWSLAATAVEPWMMDDAQYEIYVTESQPLEPKLLVAIAQLSGRNALEVRRALLEGRLLVATGYFDEIEPVRARLEELGVQFEVEGIDDA